jgi:hypothetical protein
MDAATVYIREHPEIMQWAVNSCLEQGMLCIENCGGHFEKLQDISLKM